GVDTGALDGSQGSASQGATEFTPMDRAIFARSSLTNNEFYSKSAVSELDFISDFNDSVPRRSDNNGEDHRPMGIRVHQENYSWSFSDFAHTNFFHFEITNTGRPLQNVWVGFYAEMASGNKKAQSVWPSSGWFNKKWIACDGTRTMKPADSVKATPPLFREHYCLAAPIPQGCNLQVAPYWVGIKVLGYRTVAGDTATKKTTLAAWRY